MSQPFIHFLYIFSYTIMTIYIPIGIKSQTISEKTKTYLEKIKSELPDSLKEKLNLDDPQMLLRIGSRNAYFGNNEQGNEIMRYAISKYPNVTGDDYHEWSVQNTKNGNYVTAIEALEKAVSLDPNVHGYYGWVLLYYYHDYTKALEHLELFDKLTPNFTDAPGGEDIHFQKGLCHMKLKNYAVAIREFDLNISEVSKKYGKKWTNPYCSLYKGRCLEQIQQLKKADKAYANAIVIDSNCTEAHYFKAINLINLQKINAARPLLKKALSLIEKGNKQTDVYVELFDEIYKEDIEEAIKKYL
jgi:tetratricopeptide (TPR) repeat protein